MSAKAGEVKEANASTSAEATKKITKQRRKSKDLGAHRSVCPAPSYRALTIRVLASVGLCVIIMVVFANTSRTEPLPVHSVRRDVEFGVCAEGEGSYKGDLRQV